MLPPDRPARRPPHRSRFGILVGTAVALLWTVVAAHVPSEFGYRIDVTPSPGAALARVALPSASFAALRTRDGGDLRVFNAEGRVLPYALLDARAAPNASVDRFGERVIALPIRSEAAIGRDTPTLRIEETPTRRVIEYAPTQSSAKARPDASTAPPRALLFDTRDISTPVRAIDFEGTLPAATIVSLTIDGSDDLRQWRRVVTDAPVFDFTEPNGSAAPSNRRVELPKSAGAASLKGRYLRVTWSNGGSAAGLTALRPVLMDDTSTPAAELPLGPPRSAADDAAEWTLPPALGSGASARLLGLRFATTATNSLMPLTISTRERAGEPWRIVASTVVFHFDGQNGAVTPRAPLATQLRVEPARGYSLRGVPLTLTLEYAPMQVLFVATGPAPFTIAAGKTGLTTAALPVATLMPIHQPGAEFTVPLATLASQSAGTPKAESSLADSIGRSTLLWGVLLVAVVVLAGLALSLLRRP